MPPRPSGELPLDYRLADVFAERPYEGNGVSIFIDTPRLSARALQAITVEVRQFESAFLWSTEDPHVFDTRIFVVDQELAFAGHPALGAAAVLHERHLRIHPADGPLPAGELSWSLKLGEREVGVTSRKLDDGIYSATMDQGRPAFGAPVSAEFRERVAHAVNLRAADLKDALPMQWVSTGLKYLMIPVHQEALAKARIATSTFAALLAEAGAQLAYVFSTDGPEGRNWINDGSVEDIATGSAAGPAAAYLVRHGVAAAGVSVEISQGRFLNRPSTMTVDVIGDEREINGVLLTGRVCMSGSGSLDQSPHYVDGPNS